MTRPEWLACVGMFILTVGFGAHAQEPPEAVPDQPFKTVHLMAVEPDQEPALEAAIRDFNQDFEREGCSTCGYHLLRMFAGSQSPYNFIVYADWPSRSEYARIHDSADYASTVARNPVFETLESKQFYGRFIEVK